MADASRPCGLHARSGHGLLAVMWICMGIGVVGLALSEVANRAAAASRNRTASMQSDWVVRGCLARLRAAVSDELRNDDRERARIWERLDSAAPLAGGSECVVEASAVGAALDINSIDVTAARALLHASGFAAGTADSIAAAIVDWRDADRETLPLGAEEGWYRAAGRPQPTNRPFQSVHELRRVRGLEQDEVLVRHVRTVGGPVALNHASAAVLMTLPGFSARAVHAVIAARSAGIRPADFDELAGLFEAEDRVRLYDAIPELMSSTVFETESWIITASAASARGHSGLPIEARLTRRGRNVYWESLKVSLR